MGLLGTGLGVRGPLSPLTTVPTVKRLLLTFLITESKGSVVHINNKLHVNEQEAIMVSSEGVFIPSCFLKMLRLFALY